MNISYLQPHLSSLLLVALLLLILYHRLFLYKTSLQKQFQLIASHTATNPSLFWLRSCCLVFSWILLACSLMQPAKVENKEDQIDTRRISSFNEIAFFLDNSQSMAIQDTATHISRFDRAKEVIESIVENLAGIPISLATFSGTVMNTCPATMDYLFFRLTLQSQLVNDTPIPGTDFSQIASDLQNRYGQNPTRKKTLFILLSDGEDTTLLDLPSDERKGAYKKAASQIVNAPQSSFTQFNTIGFGSRTGKEVPDILLLGKPVLSSFQPGLMREIALQGRGHFFEEADISVPQIVKEIYVDVIADSSQQGKRVLYSDMSGYLVITALLFLIIALVLPQTRSAR